MLNIKYEITRELPNGEPFRTFKGGEPILYAFNCALLEQETSNGFIYSIENLTTGKKETFGRRKTALLTTQVENIVEKIRHSKIAGAGHYEADRPPGESISISKAREILNFVFHVVFPQNGYMVRPEQISLSQHMLDAIARRKVILAESEVGTGKTHAYLVAAIIAKRGRLNDNWNAGLYNHVPYVATLNMPLVIATSSIALQRAILTQYIPELSRELLENGIIKTPLTAVLRKGKINYVCERNLRLQLFFEKNPQSKQVLLNLLSPLAEIDFAEIDGITPHIRRKIAVPQRCYHDCTYRESCQYLCFRKDAQTSAIDIQICNHSYLFADTLRRAAGESPLIPNYQILIVDEAHKLLSTARMMYGTELSDSSFPQVLSDITKLSFKTAAAQRIAFNIAKSLSDTGRRLFKSLLKLQTCTDDNYFSIDIDEDNVHRLHTICNSTESLIDLLDTEFCQDYGTEHMSLIKWTLEQLHEQATILTKHNNLICWIETDKKENFLCTIPKDLGWQLFADQWGKGIPTILTSGTLSSRVGTSCAGDFTHIKRILGLDNLGNRMIETSIPSPFNFQENVILYISETMPFPEQHNKNYLTAIANEIRKLIIASHGHAAILFTSYRAMDIVWEQLIGYGLPFPLFRLDKGGVREIERFKHSKNGILLAAGALWEGIDIPGDALSMLIIVKLPFQVPDPISDYERSEYPDFYTYRDCVIVPEMLIKLKQGFGRLIRSEKDTGAVAILDSRVNSKGIYRSKVLAALPSCQVTNSITVLKQFIRTKKHPDYFK